MTLRRVCFAVVLLIGFGAAAQDPLVTLPNNYKVVFANADVTVIRAHYGPHEKLPVHDHTSYATVFVYLSDSGAVRIDHVEAGGTPVSIVRPPTFMGAYRVAAGLKETHSIENLGDRPSDFLRVELKNVTLELQEPFRGKAVGDLTHASDKVELNVPGLEIERIVCPGPVVCLVAPNARPSLLVALAPETLKIHGQPGRSLVPGEVTWLTGSVSAELTAQSGPAQILRIIPAGK